MPQSYFPTIHLKLDPAKPFVLVGCSAQKLDQAAPAQDLYRGDLFLKARAYAEALGADWRILSALHGILHPTDLVEPYDVCLDKMRVAEVQEWGHSIGCRLHIMLRGSARPITVLAGQAYREPLFSSLQGRLYAGQVVAPLAGLGIGQQKAWLIQATRDLQNQTEMAIRRAWDDERWSDMVALSEQYGRLREPA